MILFSEDSTLKSMNDVLVKEIPKYTLIGDIPLSDQDFYHLSTIIGLIYGRVGAQQIIKKYEECLAVFLVFCAVYEYDRGTFWKPIEKYLGDLSYNRRMDLFSVFSRVLGKYKMNPFENEGEEGLTYVTPILCHAGIPVNALDDYFSAISNTVNDSFYDDFDVDDYLYYLKNKTEITVKRYLRLGNKRDSYNFIQNTRKLIISDTVDNDENLENGIFLRMCDQISKWREKPKVKKNLQAKSNVQITAPKIKLDLDGVGIYCELPRIIVKECYDSYLVWEIKSDETTTMVKSDLYKRSGVFVSEEKIITLKPATNYLITLKVDDNLISKWEFDGVKDGHLAFTQNGNIIKSEALPNSLVTFLLKRNLNIIGKEDLAIMEMPQIPAWTEFNVYRIELSKLKILHCTGFNISIHSENKPIVEGGRALFNQDNSRAYIDLPYLKVPVTNAGEWHLEMKHKAGTDVLNKTNVVVDAGSERISLGSYIPENCYGEYEIKIWNRAGFNGKFTIEYVPYGTIEENKNNYWPSSYQGYLNNIQVLRSIPGVDIEIFNAEKVSEIRNHHSILHKYKVNERDRFLIGEYRYSYGGNTFSTPIKKSIHPISWGIVGIEDDIIDLSSRVYKLTLQDFENAINPYLFFAFDFNSNDDINFLQFDLVRADQEVLRRQNLSIKNKDGLRISLNSFLFEIQNSKGDIDYHLRVSLLNANELPISSFSVIYIQEEVILENAQFLHKEKSILIRWKEKGACIGRECVMLNFLKPWSTPYHFKIEDKKCQLTINSDILEEGAYKYLIQKETDYLFLEEEEAEICSLRDFQKGLLVGTGNKSFTTDMEKLLYQLLRTRFIKKEKVPKRLRQIEAQIRNLEVNVPNDLHLLANAYILFDRFFSKKEDAANIRKLFKLLFELFSNHEKESARYVLESNFSASYKKELLHQFYCNNLTAFNGFDEVQLKQLAEIDEDMSGFIQLIQSDHNRGLHWAGISDLEVLKEDDLFGEGDGDTTFLSDENLGKSSYINEYFQYVSTCLLRPKNMAKSTEDFIRDFHRDNKVQETLIFGKTRLHLLVDWKEKNKNSKEIQYRLEEVLSIPCDSTLKNQFEDAIRAIAKRKFDDELGYYIGLIALYASFIRNGLMQERKEFNRLLHDTINQCGKLYYRDAIIIELYMQKERGFSWV